jgi:hypothetical protein
LRMKEVAYKLESAAGLLEIVVVFSNFF